MKQPWLGAMVFLAIAAASPTARAIPFDFTYTGSLVTFTVPESGLYQILAFGAEGGSGIFCGATCFIGAGGRGAKIGGDFDLTAGETLQIAVGGAGTSGVDFRGGSGGGGSFVVGPVDTPLVIAGGGGGGGAFLDGALPGGAGLTGPNGGDAAGSGGSGGSGGAGGDLFGGGGGGGFFSAGGDADFLGGTGGSAFPDLAGGSFAGGFGGGGGAGDAAGGGGGYSGGGGGGRGPGGVGQGGGGGSFDAGINQILVADFQVGNGEVIITEIPAAIREPSSVALIGAGLFGLAAVWRQRRRT